MLRALARAGTGHVAIDARSRQTGATYANKIDKERDAHRLDEAMAMRSMTIAAACRPFPALGSSLPASDA